MKRWLNPQPGAAEHGDQPVPTQNSPVREYITAPPMSEGEEDEDLFCRDTNTAKPAALSRSTSKPAIGWNIPYV